MVLTGKSKHLLVSRYYFRLTTEAIRLQSNLLTRHTTFSELASRRAAHACELVDRYDAAELNEHLRIIPSAGEVEFDFAISDICVHLFESAIPGLEKYLSRQILFIDVLSLLLFDLIVEANATEVLTKLGLSSAQAKSYRVILRKKPDKVVPIR